MREIWVAVDAYPESTKVFAAETEQGLLKALVADIGRDDYETFVDSLTDDEATDVTFDHAPEDVLRVWAGERQWDPDDGNAYWIGGDWCVRRMTLIPATAIELAGEPENESEEMSA